MRGSIPACPRRPAQTGMSRHPGASFPDVHRSCRHPSIPVDTSRQSRQDRQSRQSRGSRTRTKIHTPALLSPRLWLSTKRRDKELRRSVKRQSVETKCGNKVRGQGVGTRYGDGARAAQRFYPLNCEPLSGRNNRHSKIAPPAPCRGTSTGKRECGDKVQVRSTHSSPSLNLALNPTLKRHTPPA